MRAIDADAMLTRLEEWNTSDSTDKALYNFTLHRILEQPTIEPQRKKGRWIDDLISRQAALDEFQRFGSVWMEYTDDMPAEKIAWMALKNAKSSMIDVLNGLPTVDAVEVVPCKDCRYGHRYFDIIYDTTDSWIECRNPDGLNRDVSEDSYCSYGERKDG